MLSWSDTVAVFWVPEIVGGHHRRIRHCCVHADRTCHDSTHQRVRGCRDAGISGACRHESPLRRAASRWRATGPRDQRPIGRTSGTRCGRSAALGRVLKIGRLNIGNIGFTGDHPVKIHTGKKKIRPNLNANPAQSVPFGIPLTFALGHNT